MKQPTHFIEVFRYEQHKDSINNGPWPIEYFSDSYRDRFTIAIWKIYPKTKPND